MNGRSGENNVEIKSGQQVCSIFFLFFFIHLAGPAFCSDRGSREKRKEFARQMNEKGGGERRREGMVYHTLASS